MNNQINPNAPAYPIDLYTDKQKENWTGEKYNGMPLRFLVAKDILCAMIINQGRYTEIDDALDLADIFIDKYTKSQTSLAGAKVS